ncbi:hypothetical protein GCM10022420_036270 [Streptomyces iranensis]
MSYPRPGVRRLARSPSYRWEVPPLAALPKRPCGSATRALRRLAIARSPSYRWEVPPDAAR